MKDPYPDELKARDHLDSIIGKGRGDPDMHRRIVYVGEDKAVVQRVAENPHWSELPKPTNNWPPREYGDNDKSDPFNNVDEENEL